VQVGASMLVAEAAGVAAGEQVWEGASWGKKEVVWTVMVV